MTLQEKLTETIQYIHNQGVQEVEFGLILGSGLGELAEEIEDKVVIPYANIPHFPVFYRCWACRTTCLWYFSREKSIGDARSFPLL